LTFFFFSLSTSIFVHVTLDFQNSHSIFFSSNLIHILLINTFYLKWFLKSKFFQFHPPLIFYLSDLILICFGLNNFQGWCFLQLSSFIFFSLCDLILIFLIAILFFLKFIFNLIYFLRFHPPKLNWLRIELLYWTWI